MKLIDIIKQKINNYIWRKRLAKHSIIYTRTLFVQEHKRVIYDIALTNIYKYPEYYVGKKDPTTLTEDEILQARLQFHDEFVDEAAKKLNIMLFEEGDRR